MFYLMDVAENVSFQAGSACTQVLARRPQSVPLRLAPPRSNFFPDGCNQLQHQSRAVPQSAIRNPHSAIWDGRGYVFWRNQAETCGIRWNLNHLRLEPFHASRTRLTSAKATVNKLSALPRRIIRNKPTQR